MPTLDKNELRHFSGSLERFRHSLNPMVIYTPGIQYLAEKGEAYWLVDAIASWIGSREFNLGKANDPRISFMHVWTLETSDQGAGQLNARADSPEKPFITQNIPFTDFPLRKIEIWAGFDGEHWTLYLPSEH